jgi:hypothetical protein
MDPEDDYFDYGQAVEVGGDRLIPNAPLTVVVPGTNMPTPITDMAGVPITAFASGEKAVIPQFRSVDGLKTVDILSGSLRTRVTSMIGRQGPKGEDGAPGMGADPAGSMAGQVLVSAGPGVEPVWADNTATVESIEDVPGLPEALAEKATAPAGTPGRLVVLTPDGIAASEVSPAAFATASQGAKADTAVQPAALTPLAPKASPVFTGTPKAPTPATSSADDTVATTGFVQDVVAGIGGGANPRRAYTGGAWEPAGGLGFRIWDSSNDPAAPFPPEMQTWHWWIRHPEALEAL